MEYIYAVMLLNKAGKTVDDKSVTAVLKAAGVDVDGAKVKSLIAALDGVDIEEVIANSSVVATPTASSSAPATSSAPAPTEKKKEEAPAVDASAGLGSLF